MPKIGQRWRKMTAKVRFLVAIFVQKNFIVELQSSKREHFWTLSEFYFHTATGWKMSICKMGWDYLHENFSSAIGHFCASAWDRSSGTYFINAQADFQIFSNWKCSLLTFFLHRILLFLCRTNTSKIYTCLFDSRSCYRYHSLYTKKTTVRVYIIFFLMLSIPANTHPKCCW